MFVINFYKTLTFLSSSLLFLCVYIYIYIYIWRRDIKGEQKYIFTPDFNKSGLWDRTNLKLVK